VQGPGGGHALGDVADDPHRVGAIFARCAAGDETERVCIDVNPCGYIAWRSNFPRRRGSA
jgi:hypothetical protein